MPKHLKKFLYHKYPIGAIAIVYVLMFFSIVGALFVGFYIIWFAVLVLGAYLAFSHFGLLIDLKRRRFRYYRSQFGIKKGTWKSLHDYPYLSLLTINRKQTVYSGTNAQATTRFVVYRVCLLNKKHTIKIILKEFDGEKVAENYLEALAKELGLERAVYSPDFS